MRKNDSLNRSKPGGLRRQSATSRTYSQLDSDTFLSATGTIATATATTESFRKMSNPISMQDKHIDNTISKAPAAVQTILKVYR
jgi:hypothetical protein